LPTAKAAIFLGDNWFAAQNLTHEAGCLQLIFGKMMRRMDLIFAGRAMGER